MICSPRQPLMKLSTLQLESLICMIVQLTTPYTGKLAFNDGVKRPVSTPFVHSSRSVLGISSKRCSSSMLRKFNLFLTIIGTVRFLICSGIRLRLYAKSSLVPLFMYFIMGTVDQYASPPEGSSRRDYNVCRLKTSLLVIVFGILSRQCNIVIILRETVYVSF